MSYEPKFKTGETVEVKGVFKDAYTHGQIVIIATWQQFYSYTDNLTYADIYNDNDTQHTLYATYCPETNGVWWYWEGNLLKYCKNTDRGKKILRDILHLLPGFYGINPINLSKFSNNFLMEDKA